MTRPKGQALVLLLLLIALPLALPLRAQQAPPAPTVTAAPPETRDVVAEGRAVIGTGGVPGAREAAVQQALRNAVEKTTGVFVSARTLTSNYRLVQDEVTTRAEGFATLKEVLSEKAARGEVRVTVRALVSLRPLARRLKELNLTRAWRISVEPAEIADLSDAVATLERNLGDAGFVVVSDGGKADLIIRVRPKFVTVAETALETAAGPMTLYSVRGEITVRALRSGTSEVVAALSAAEVRAHIDKAAARAVTGGSAMAILAPRLADALMLLPARSSQPVLLVVSNLVRIGQVARLHDALRSLPGVRQVTRRSWEKGAATWELDVTADAVPLLGRALEEDVATRPFRLAVSSESRARIVAAVSRPAAVR